MKIFPEVDDATLAKLVETELAVRGISDVAIAEKLDLTKQSVGQWFTKGKIPPKRIPGLALLLGTTVENLLAGNLGKQERMVNPHAGGLDYSQLSDEEWTQLLEESFPKLALEDKAKLLLQLPREERKALQHLLIDAD